MDEQLCPYCNGLCELYVKCPACSGFMEDCGALQNVLGPYAPYEETDLLLLDEGCIHQLYCHFCDTKYRLSIPTQMATFQAFFSDQE